MTEEIKRRASEIEGEIIKLRRELHQHPEKSGSEYLTRDILMRYLSELDVEIGPTYFKTGFAVVIRGREVGKTIALRFDMDALEMDELADCPFKSKHDGLMHACGHDGHMAMGVGCAMVLSKLKHMMKGQVKLIFQPAEEDAVSGGGAKYMIEEGVLDDAPRVDAVVGMHIWPELKKGEVGTKYGPIMAASDPFEISISGVGGHASLPHKCVDPILIASQIVVSLQSVVARNIDPFDAAVITVGQLSAGTRYNTIPQTASLKGTLRSFSQETRDVLKSHLEKIATAVATGYGGEAKLMFGNGYPALVNDDEMVADMKATVASILGEDAFKSVERPASGGEDFAYFALERPSVYLWLGYGESEAKVNPPHSPYYAFDEKILKDGVMTLCQVAVDFLK